MGAGSIDVNIEACAELFEFRENIRHDTVYTYIPFLLTTICVDFPYGIINGYVLRNFLLQFVPFHCV